jgi:hypothetical protein
MFGGPRGRRVVLRRECIERRMVASRPEFRPQKALGVIVPGQQERKSLGRKVS